MLCLFLCARLSLVKMPTILMSLIGQLQPLRIWYSYCSDININRACQVLFTADFDCNILLSETQRQVSTQHCSKVREGEVIQAELIHWCMPWYLPWWLPWWLLSSHCPDRQDSHALAWQDTGFGRYSLLDCDWLSEWMKREKLDTLTAGKVTEFSGIERLTKNRNQFQFWNILAWFGFICEK